MARKTRLYIWEGICNVVWTGGDLIIAAFSEQEARVIAGQLKYAAYDIAGVPQVHEVKGFTYEGPGGA